MWVVVCPTEVGKLPQAVCNCPTAAGNALGVADAARAELGAHLWASTPATAAPFDA